MKDADFQKLIEFKQQELIIKQQIRLLAKVN